MVFQDIFEIHWQFLVVDFLCWIFGHWGDHIYIIYIIIFLGLCGNHIYAAPETVLVFWGRAVKS